MQPVARILGALAMGAVASAAPGASTEEADPVARSYRFLVMPVERGGVLYTATAGSLDRKRLPLSFIDDARYWGEKVCRFPSSARHR
jgi:hypothetical protein